MGYDSIDYAVGYQVAAALALPFAALILSAVLDRPCRVARLLLCRWWRRSSVRRLAAADVGWLFYPARRVVSACRYAVSPHREIRRRVGRRLAAPHSGLTEYEQIARDIESLPCGAVRLALRYQLRSMPPPSAGAVAQARRRAGRPVAPSGLVRCLLRGEKPSYYSDVV